MTTTTIRRNWDAIDRQATREARALRRARKHRPTHAIARRDHSIANRTEQMSAEQALFDEALAIAYTTCSFCGRTLKPPVDEQGVLRLETDESGNFIKLIGGYRCSLFTQNIDICNQCSYLHGVLIRSGTLRHTE